MQLLKRHDFAMIWLAGLVAYIGNGMFFVALPIWVYQEYGSATLVGTAALMTIIPSVALGSIAGVFVDRWDRARVMSTIALIRVALFLILALATQIDWFWLILAVRFATASAMQFFGPAEQSLLPKLVESESEFVQANSLNQLNNNLGAIIGNGLGGVLLLWLGLEGIAIGMAALAAVSALLISRIRYDDRRSTVMSNDSTRTFWLSYNMQNLTSEWRDGMMLYARNPSVRILFLIVSVASVSNVGVNTLLVVFALETLKVNEAGVGLLFMAGSVGGLLGAVLLGLVPSRFSTQRIFQACILTGAILEAIYYGYPLFTGGVLIASMVIDFVAGFPNAGLNATGMTVFQMRVPDHLLGRALGSLGSLQALVMLVATPVAGILADRFSAQSVLLGITLFLFASWVLSLRLSDESNHSERFQPQWDDAS